MGNIIVPPVQTNGGEMGIVVLEQFAGCVGEGFAADVGGSMVMFTLTEAQPLPESGLSGVQRVPFSLLFRSDLQIVLPQQIYRLNNAVLGILDIFLVPVARDKDGIIYQAVFN